MQNLAFGPGNEGREVFWNTVNYQIPLDVFALIALAICGWGLYKRSDLWKAMGKAEVRDDNRGERIKNLFRNGILQLSVWRDFYPGLIHGLIFFAFFVLIWGAAIDATSFYTGVHLPGKGYLAFSFIMDLFGLFAIVGCILAIDRRYIKKPDRLGYKGVPDNRPDDAIVLVLILAIMVTG
jgi:nitrate reductase gamma subunit